LIPEFTVSRTDGAIAALHLQIQQIAHKPEERAGSGLNEVQEISIIVPLMSRVINC
jgi:hypothetical protein